jgi:hypothetical protein
MSLRPLCECEKETERQRKESKGMRSKCTGRKMHFTHEQEETKDS